MSNNAFMLPTYPPGDEKTRQDVGIVVTIILTILGMAFVGLRVYTRARIVRNMGYEDWTMILAAMLTMVFAGQLLVSMKVYNLGFSGMSLTVEQNIQSTKLGLAGIAVYKTTVTLIKASIVMIYLRLSVTKTFEWLCKGSIYLLFTYQAIVLIVLPLECIPLRKLWDFTGTVQGHCIDSATFYLITSGFHILMDVWILFLPYKLILTIKRPTREKLAVYSVFGLGAFGTLCAIIRFHFLVVLIKSSDPYYDSLGLNVWSIIEVNVGIICASLPTLRPLVSRAQRTRTMQALGVTEKSKESSPRSSKRGGLLQAKEMFITLGTLTGSKNRQSTIPDEEEYRNEKAPPVPPKDPNATPSPAVSYPDMSYQKY